MQCKNRMFIAAVVMMLVVGAIGMVKGSDVSSAKNKSQSKLKAKTLKMEPKETYKIKCKNASKYTSSKPRVASVSKKGKIKAKETGNTTIKVYNKKNKCIKKYNVAVRRIKGRYPKNSVVGCNTMTLRNLENADDSYLNLYFEREEIWSWGIGYITDQYKYIKLKVKKDNYSDIEFIVDKKYIVTLTGEYQTEGECAVFSDENTSTINIDIAREEVVN